MNRRELLAGLLAFPIPFEQQIRAAERRIFDLINDDRTRAGLTPLLWNDAVAEVARNQSTRMMVRGFFAHQDPEYGLLQNRLDAAGIGWSHCAENIFHCHGWEDPTRLADVCWMTSAGHRANILLDSVSLSGVGVACRPKDDWFVTQIFTAPRLSSLRRPSRIGS